VVLHQPEIPNNTGNIGRTCVATRCALHLIHPLGFEVSEKACRRAGLDYWPRLNVREHPSWDDYLAAGGTGDAGGPPRLWLFHPRSDCSVYDADLRPGDHLIFGRETAGLPPDILARYPGRRVFLPMAGGERSLNLATAVCAVVYEGLRQMAARREVFIAPGGEILLPGEQPG
jgi:tRNA (cytidine/uridine-2'-O-)-methyltransferase